MRRQTANLGGGGSGGVDEIFGLLYRRLAELREQKANFFRVIYGRICHTLISPSVINFFSAGSC
jgi:hypothetical protein